MKPIKEILEKAMTCKHCGARLPYYKSKICKICKGKQ